jgi:DNA-binding response OmpR family regulator
MSVPSIKNYKILIADKDRELVGVLSNMLKNIGFSAPYVTSSGRDAIGALNKQSFDFLITEWNVEQLNGIEVIKTIRMDPLSPCPTLPIIMLTGRAEQIDVITARDAGVNEYVAKPFSVKTVYSRLERIIMQPRNFVVTKKFVGPDRRNRSKPPAEIADRRVNVLRPNQSSQTVSAKMIGASESPRLWAPDYSLKAKLGAGNSLQSIITPEILEKAQSLINAITQDSLEWIKKDLQLLDGLAKNLMKEGAAVELIAQVGELALSINSRAGTFGYDQVAKIAYMLYLFCRNKLQLQNEQHVTIVQKYVDVMYVIMSQRLLGEGDVIADEIIEGLKTMTEKLA